MDEIGGADGFEEVEKEDVVLLEGHNVA